MNADNARAARARARSAAHVLAEVAAKVRPDVELDELAVDETDAESMMDLLVAQAQLSARLAALVARHNGSTTADVLRSVHTETEVMIAQRDLDRLNDENPFDGA